MALNATRMKRTQQRTKAGGGGVWRPKNPRHVIRLFSFQHTVCQADFDNKIYTGQDVKIGEVYDEIEREVWRHFVGDEEVVNCIGRECEHCAESKQLLNSDDKQDQKFGKALKARRVFYVNMVDLDAVDAGMKIGAIPSSVYSVMLDYIIDPEYGESTIGPNGRDFIIDKDKNAELPQDMYKVKIRDKDKCIALDPSLAKNVQDLFTMSMLDRGFTSQMKKKDGAPAAANPTPAPTAKAPESKLAKATAPNVDNDFKDGEQLVPSLRETNLALKNGKSTEPAAPWEQPKQPDDPNKLKILSAVGHNVTFKDAGEEFIGIAMKSSDDLSTVEVHVGNDIFDLPASDFEILPDKAAPVSSTRRRK
jgi:hypothetical protein